MMKTLNRCFKHPSGTRWVAHQSDATDAFLVNLSLLLGYLKNQIADPYNATAKKEVPRLQGVLSSCSNLVTLVFQEAKLDILNLIKPTTLVLQSTNLFLLEAVTTINITVTKIKKLLSKFEEKGIDALQDKSLSPTLILNSCCSSILIPMVIVSVEAHIEILLPMGSFYTQVTP